MTTLPATPLLNAHAVRAALSISTATLYRLMARGEFPRPIKIGAKSLWPQAEIESYLASRFAAREVAA
jgi:prophage regulatory protein